MRSTDREPLGAPPPQYPGKVVAIRRFGVEVADDDAIGTVVGLGFDVLIRTSIGDQVFEDVASSCPPPPNDVDINPNTVVGRTVACWYYPEEQAIDFMIPLYSDSAECGG